ncbi:MAG: catalase family protein [Methylococcaceae bacterium]
MEHKTFLSCPFEHPQTPDKEAEQIKEISDLTIDLLDKRYPPPDKILRGVHPKSHGCVKATFEITEDIDLQHQVGLFSSPGEKYDAIIRFSNASARLGPDINENGEHGSRGMAIKVFNLIGDVLLEDNGAKNQDFLMINQPVFAFANTEDYLRLTRIIDKNNDNPTAFFSPLKLNAPKTTEQQKQQILDYIKAENISEEDIKRIFTTFKIVQGIQATATANPLNIQYFSAAPFLFGADKVMKFSVKPLQQVNPVELPENPSADYLQNALTESMSQNQTIEFDFMVQLRNDENMMIENASSLWDEDRFPFIKLAKIKISTPQTDITAMESTGHCEALEFTPWHSLTDHQPIGSINRLRKSVYQASAAHRNQQRPDDDFFLIRLIKKIFKFIIG